MHMMRRLKSTASGRTSVSDPDGDLGIKRPEVDQGERGEVLGEQLVERQALGLDLHSASTRSDTGTSISSMHLHPRTDETCIHQLPKEMHEMTIGDDKATNQKDTGMAPATVNSNNGEAGHVIATTIGGRNGQPKQDGDLGIKRPKVDQGERGEVLGEQLVERKALGLDLRSVSTRSDTGTSISCMHLHPRTDETCIHQLPKEMHEMTIGDDKAINQKDTDMAPATVNSNNGETGHVIATTIGGRNGQPKQWTVQRLQRFVVLRFCLGLCWCFLHLFVNVVHLWSRVIHVLQCYMISSGLLKDYRTIRLDRLRYLALVVDSEEAKDKGKIRQLLLWLSAIGVKKVILYDIEGVLKKSMETDLRRSTDSSSTPGFDAGVMDISSVISHEKMSIELLSFSDGKEAVAKAATFLCSKYLDNDSTEKVFTESDMENALKAVGCSGPEPDLLLVYGPVRCHLGFPSWRLRYTEIVHMGSLKSTKYGAIVKAIYDFSKKHQNYGT